MEHFRLLHSIYLSYEMKKASREWLALEHTGEVLNVF
jgi:hypothetical protein